MNSILAKGRCPGLFAPMAAGDGMLVRVRPPAGILPAAAARTLAAAASCYGNGLIELGNRASLQVRGLRHSTVGAFADAMVAAGLAHADPQAEARRNVIAPPLAGDDPSAAASAGDVTRELEAMQVRESGLSVLPGKFGVVVDAGGVLPVGAAAADIRVRLRDATARVALDGSDIAAVCDVRDTADVVLRLSRAFIALAGETARPRMRDLVARTGAASVFASADLTAQPEDSHPRVPVALGWLPYGLGGRGAFGVGLPFGQIHSATLMALADIVENHGDGTLRATPWRAFAIAGVTAAAKLRDALAPLDLVVSPDDSRARIAVCSGQPACGSASVPTRTLATQLAALRLPGSLHVSGCAKGCAHPAAADVTIVGDNGRYSVVSNGRANDTPTRSGLTSAELVVLIAAQRQAGSL